MKTTITYILSSTLCLCSFFGSAQNSWRSITPTNSFFSFSFPGIPQDSIDTLGVLDYSINQDGIGLSCGMDRDDSSFVYYLNEVLAHDSVAPISRLDSLANPIVGLTGFFLTNYDSIQVLKIQNLMTGKANLSGRELSIAYSNNNEPLTLFSIRMYYNGKDLLYFSIEAPKEKELQFIALKNDFFNSIQIN